MQRLICHSITWFLKRGYKKRVKNEYELQRVCIIKSLYYQEAKGKRLDFSSLVNKYKQLSIKPPKQKGRLPVCPCKKELTKHKLSRFWKSLTRVELSSLFFILPSLIPPNKSRNIVKKQDFNCHHFSGT